jgi:hypothetical protein
MKKVLFAAAAAALVADAVPTAAGAADSYYLLSVDIPGADGRPAVHKQVKCPRYEDCRESFPVVIEGKKRTLHVTARVQDEHYIYVTADADLPPSPAYLNISGDVATKPSGRWS